MCLRLTMNVGRGIYVAGRQGDTTASVRQEQVS